MNAKPPTMGADMVLRGRAVAAVAAVTAVLGVFGALTERGPTGDRSPTQAPVTGNVR